jgi:hypothetical protein
MDDSEGVDWWEEVEWAAWFGRVFLLPESDRNKLGLLLVGGFGISSGW